MGLMEVLVYVAAVVLFVLAFWRLYQRSTELVAFFESVVVAAVGFVLAFSGSVTDWLWLVFVVLVLYALGVLFRHFSFLGLFRSRDTVS